MSNTLQPMNRERGREEEAEKAPLFTSHMYKHNIHIRGSVHRLNTLPRGKKTYKNYSLARLEI